MTAPSLALSLLASNAISHNLPRGGASGFVQLSKPANLKSRNQSSAPEQLWKILYSRWYQIATLPRFFVSGNLGNICFYFIERAINQKLQTMTNLPTFVNQYQDTVSFFVGYCLQIVSQHLLHAILVYGLDTINTREKYIRTLMGQFSAYGFALIGSTLLNLFLLEMGLDKTVAFFSTMIVFACLNYFLIGWIVRRAVESDPKANNTRNNSAQQRRQRKQQQQNRISSNNTRKWGSSYSRVQRGGAAFVPRDSDQRGNYSFGLPWVSSSSPSLYETIVEAGPPVNVNAINLQE